MKNNIKKQLILNIIALFIITLILIISIILSFFYGENISHNNILCGLVGTFIGVISALFYNKIFDTFKKINLYKDWLDILKKEFEPMIKIDNNTKHINFSCLQSLVNSSDFIIFKKEKQLMANIYNLYVYLLEFNKGDKTEYNIKNIVNEVRDFLNYCKNLKGD